MPRLFVQIDFLEQTVADFGWVEPLAEGLGQLGLDAEIRLAEAPSGREPGPLGPAELQTFFAESDPAVRNEAAGGDHWYAYLLVAGQNPELLGVLFDVDFDARDREGCALFAHRITEIGGGDVELTRRLFTRTALHELGHCLNLVHPNSAVDRSLMAQTGRLRADAAWPGNIRFDYSELDRRFVRDNPDQSRPGNGVPFRGTNAGDRARRSETLAVSLEAVGAEGTGHLYLGCPVSLLLHQENKGQRSRTVYTRPSLSEGTLELEIQRLRDGLHQRYEFPFYGCVHHRRMRTLSPGEKQTTALSLFHHRRGFAFPEAGPYRVRARVKHTWQRPSWLLSDWLDIEILEPPHTDPALFPALFHPGLGHYIELSGVPYLEEIHRRAERLVHAFHPSPPTGHLIHCISRVLKFRGLTSGDSNDLRNAFRGFEEAGRTQTDPIARWRSAAEEAELLDLMPPEPPPAVPMAPGSKGDYSFEPEAMDLEVEASEFDDSEFEDSEFEDSGAEAFEVEGADPEPQHPGGSANNYSKSEPSPSSSLPLEHLEQSMLWK